MLRGREICSPEEPSLDSLPRRRASPWKYYTKAYSRELWASIVVVCKNRATFELFEVKCVAASEVNDQAQALHQVRHENFLACYKIFVCGYAIFIVSECMAITPADLSREGKTDYYTLNIQKRLLLLPRTCPNNKDHLL